METKNAHSWPKNGEIDIIEGANLQIGNKNTMHTTDGCSFDGRTCLGNMGCAKPKWGGANVYGDGFNANHGGIFAMEWTSHHIGFWFFAHGSEPEDVLGDAPDPSRWGPPMTDFIGGDNCDIDTHFMNHKIVFDMTFCGAIKSFTRRLLGNPLTLNAGDWAGGTFIQDPPCLASGLTCVDYVKNHPEAFGEAYWTVNVLKVYSRNSAGPVVLTSMDITPASTPALSIISPVVTAINASLPTPFSDSNSLTSLPSLPTSVPGNTTGVISAEQQVGTEELPPGFGGSPTLTTLYISEGLVIDTVPTAAVAYYTAPTANEYRDYSPDGSTYGAPKMKRAHRAARHLKNHKSGIHG